MSLKHYAKPQITEKNMIFMDHQKMEPPNSAVPNIAETIPGVALTRVWPQQFGGGGLRTTPFQQLDETKFPTVKWQNNFPGAVGAQVGCSLLLRIGVGWGHCVPLEWMPWPCLVSLYCDWVALAQLLPLHGTPHPQCRPSPLLHKAERCQFLLLQPLQSPPCTSALNRSPSPSPDGQHVPRHPTNAQA